jgi:hypothetical protein
LAALRENKIEHISVSPEGLKRERSSNYYNNIIDPRQLKEQLANR